MNLKRKLGTAVAMVMAMLVVSASAGATTPLAGYRDAPERGSATSSGADAIAYFIANERSTLADSAGSAAIQFFRNNERATMTLPAATNGFVSYVDGGERGRPVDGALPVTEIAPTVTTGFDWGDAAVGASSAAMLALLIGGSLMLVRHSRGRELAR